ncbi:MAG TPA: transketolase [Gemmatimonadaceae bacterium]
MTSGPVSTSSATSLEDLCINTVRALAMDAVQKAESGHPGAPMALAPLAYLLYTRHLKHNPADPQWPDRDRFVLSNGHASMLLYASLHLSGYGLSLDEIRNFRQWGSLTPGHPEHDHTPGVETTTGPLGQGFTNAVGMATAEAHLAAVFNRDGHPIIDHHTWFICSDGDLMEGVSHEAASFAGHFGLGKLIGFYDDNRITIDGATDLAFSDDTALRFEGYGWHVQRVEDVNDLDALDAAIAAARAETGKPSLIIVRSVIGYGSPNRAGTAKAHGEALGVEEVQRSKDALGWTATESFTVPAEAVAYWRRGNEALAQANDAWRRALIAYAKAYPIEAKELGRRLQGELPGGWQQAVPVFTPENGSVATRASSGVVLNALASKIPELVGGSADLSGSNLTTIKDSPVFSARNYAGRNIHFGVREHAMGGIMNGMALHGGVIPYGGTFLVFSDYMRPAIRLAALMQQRVIYVFTHDSIGLGEDGPTHQPVEHLTALRTIPNVTVIRPGDAAEVAEAWRAALLHRTGPVALALTRQKVPFIDRAHRGSASELARGGYILDSGARRSTPDLVLIATGSEVSIALEAQKRIEEGGRAVRVVSMPCHEFFLQQPAEYQASVLPEGVRRIVIEAAHPMSWHRFLRTGDVMIGIDHFGASAPYQRLYSEYGITVDAVVAAAGI